MEVQGSVVRRLALVGALVVAGCGPALQPWMRGPGPNGTPPSGDPVTPVAVVAEAPPPEPPPPPVVAPEPPAPVVEPPVVVPPPPEEPPAPPPTPVVVEPPQPPPSPVVAPPPPPARPTRAQMLDVRANFCNLYDTVTGQIIFTPAITGATDEVFDRWMAQQRAAGSTHLVLTLQPDGRPAYPGVGWSNPKYWDNLPALRAFLEKVLNTRSANGAGFTPILFVGGDTFAQSEFQRWDQLAKALEGIRQHLILLEAWEPEGWSAHEISLGMEALHQHFPESVQAWHGWPARLVGSSNCNARTDRDCVPHDPVAFAAGTPGSDYGYIADDPWKGGESEFYTSHGGQFLDLAFYQFPHGRDIYADCDEGALLGPNTAAQDGCYLNRWQDYVARIGAGMRGWRKLPQIVLFETVAYETFHPLPGGPPTPDVARAVAGFGKRICDKFAVTCGYGNGLPLTP